MIPSHLRRPTITEISSRLGDLAGHRERLILIDLDSTSRLDPEYVGCVRITSPTRGSMLYHVQNNEIVG